MVKETLNVVAGRVLSKMLKHNNGVLADVNSFTDSESNRSFTLYVNEYNTHTGAILSPRERVGYLYSLVERGDIEGIVSFLDMPEKNELTAPACSHHRGIIYACRVWQDASKAIYLKHLRNIFGDLLGRRVTTEGYDHELLERWEPNRELDGPASQFHFIRLPSKDAVRPTTIRDQVLMNAVESGGNTIFIDGKKYTVSISEEIENTKEQENES